MDCTQATRCSDASRTRGGDDDGDTVVERFVGRMPCHAPLSAFRQRHGSDRVLALSECPKGTPLTLVPPGVCVSWPLLAMWNPQSSWAHRQPATSAWSLLEGAAPGRSSQCGTAVCWACTSTDSASDRRKTASLAPTVLVFPSGTTIARTIVLRSLSSSPMELPPSVPSSCPLVTRHSRPDAQGLNAAFRAILGREDVDSAASESSRGNL